MFLFRHAKRHLIKCIFIPYLKTDTHIHDHKEIGYFKPQTRITLTDGAMDSFLLKSRNIVYCHLFGIIVYTLFNKIRLRESQSVTVGKEVEKLFVIDTVPEK